MQLSPFPKASMPAQRGFSLLEILITILVVAIGSLGLASTILTGLRATNGAAERTIATQLASAFIDTMELNPYLKMNTLPTGGNPSGYGTPFNGIYTWPACYPGACGINDLSRVHLMQFKTAVAAALPSGQIQVWPTGTSPAMIAVTVGWYEQSANNDAVTGCAAVNPPPPSTINQCLTLYVVGR